ncbi:hypothetical protein GYA49_05850 [Candidatus Beckwithbacteria bacterium]|nr:hypothetical protein [Candidatus Beckwithbacteria bacterium]
MNVRECGLGQDTHHSMILAVMAEVLDEDTQTEMEELLSEILSDSCEATKTFNGTELDLKVFRDRYCKGDQSIRVVSIKLGETEFQIPLIPVNSLRRACFPKFCSLDNSANGNLEEINSQPGMLKNGITWVLQNLREWQKREIISFPFS